MTGRAPHNAGNLRRVPLRRLAATSIVNGAGEAAEDWNDGDYRYIRTTDIASLDGLNDAKKAGLPLEKGSGAVLRHDDIVMTAAGATIGKAHHWRSQEKACYAGFLVRFRANTQKCDPRFIAWWTQSQDYSHQVSAGAVRSTIDNFSAGKYRALQVPLLSLEDQVSRAEYLDHEVPKIDAMIEKQRALVDRLHRRRASVITATVTGQTYVIGGEVTMIANPKLIERRETGLKWLGAIPSEWQLRRLGSLFRERKETVSDTDYEPLSVTMQGIVPQMANVAKTMNNDARKLVRSGDFVINSRSDRKGSGGVADRDGSVSLISIVLEPHDIDPRYAHHLLRSTAFQEEFYRWGSGIVADLWSTRYQAMSRIQLPLPPHGQQVAIAVYLDNITSKIDALIARSERLIELSQERRSALITAAVTGQLNIPSDTATLEGAA
ncbi:hypothetical protein [Kocuria arenosa]|uniref:hypothetical protein n=1 Tax=Kocuria arenosa TaxID=3071446 RepID=UPI0034D4EC16